MNTKHFKAKILDLAIRGKLVPQDSSEGNAADLLQKIRDEKSELVKQKKIKEDKNASFIIKADDGKHYEQFADGSLKDIEDEIPFEIPENWCWCRIKEIMNLQAGKNIIASQIVSTQDINHKYLCYGGNGIRGYVNTFNRKGYHVLIGRQGALCGNINYADGKFYATEHAVVVELYANCFTKLIGLFLEIMNLNQYATSTAQPGLAVQTINEVLFPLPPLSEQKRIVSAIEKAFEQIDIIEKNKLNLKTYIKQTKSKVLDLAIHGKLVEQNPQEGNAFELLKKIRNEKAELIKQKKIKEDKNASFIIKADNDKHYEQFADGSFKDVEDEIPFEIPENWCWCRLREACDVLMGQSPDGNSVSEKFEGMEFHQGKIYFSDKYLSTSKIKTKEITRIAKENSILLCVRAPVGTANITTRQICIGRGLCAIKPYYEVDIAFWFYWIISQKSSFEMQATGTTFKAVTVDVVRNQLLSLPPLSEQQRIVAKIEQVFEQLDVLEKSLGE